MERRPPPTVTTELSSWPSPIPAMLPSILRTKVASGLTKSRDCSLCFLPCHHRRLGASDAISRWRRGYQPEPSTSETEEFAGIMAAMMTTTPRKARTLFLPFSWIIFLLPNPTAGCWLVNSFCVRIHAWTRRNEMAVSRRSHGEGHVP